VTDITPGAGCSITSTATVSTTGVTGCFTFCAAFFTGAGLGLALATVRLVAFARADFATLRALPRVVDFPFDSFPRLCAFARFLLLAMIRPVLVGGPQRMMSDYQVPATHRTSYQRDIQGSRLAKKAPKRDGGHGCL
jgi:hypothetical protein